MAWTFSYSNTSQSRVTINTKWPMCYFHLFPSRVNLVSYTLKISIFVLAKIPKRSPTKNPKKKTFAEHRRKPLTLACNSWISCRFRTATRTTSVSLTSWPDEATVAAPAWTSEVSMSSFSWSTWKHERLGWPITKWDQTSINNRKNWLTLTYTNHIILYYLILPPAHLLHRYGKNGPCFSLILPFLDMFHLCECPYLWAHG